MLALLQRVTEAKVSVADECIAHIETGLLAFIGVERGDAERQAERMLERLAGYRMFSDADGRMNLSLEQIQGGLLLVPQFTLPADTRKGNRPGFSPAAPPEVGQVIFEHLLMCAKTRFPSLQSGRFGANMQVALVNDGPVTFMLQVPTT
jgi:D-tyrosyl-tRNA(Tyr) deacylase